MIKQTRLELTFSRHLNCYYHDRYGHLIFHFDFYSETFIGLWNFSLFRTLLFWDFVAETRDKLFWKSRYICNFKPILKISNLFESSDPREKILFIIFLDKMKKSIIFWCSKDTRWFSTLFFSCFSYKLKKSPEEAEIS